MVQPVYTSVYLWDSEAPLGVTGWPPNIDRGYEFWLGKQPTSRRWRSFEMRRRLWDALGAQAAELLG
jgi:hypothetical protein